MVQDYPNLSPDDGDTIIARRERGWGHVADYNEAVDSDKPITVEFHGRLPLPKGRDTFDATVNDERTTVHIDLVTELFQLADDLTYLR